MKYIDEEELYNFLNLNLLETQESLNENNKESFVKDIINFYLCEICELNEEQYNFYNEILNEYNLYEKISDKIIFEEDTNTDKETMSHGDYKNRNLSKYNTDLQGKKMEEGIWYVHKKVAATKKGRTEKRENTGYSAPYCLKRLSKTGKIYYWSPKPTATINIDGKDINIQQFFKTEKGAQAIADFRNGKHKEKTDPAQDAINRELNPPKNDGEQSDDKSEKKPENKGLTDRDVEFAASEEGRKEREERKKQSTDTDSAQDAINRELNPPKKDSEHSDDKSEDKDSEEKTEPKIPKSVQSALDRESLKQAVSDATSNMSSEEKKTAKTSIFRTLSNLASKFKLVRKKSESSDVSTDSSEKVSSDEKKPDSNSNPHNNTSTSSSSNTTSSVGGFGTAPIHKTSASFTDSSKKYYKPGMKLQYDASNRGRIPDYVKKNLTTTDIDYNDQSLSGKNNSKKLNNLMNDDDELGVLTYGMVMSNSKTSPMQVPILKKRFPALDNRLTNLANNSTGYGGDTASVAKNIIKLLKSYNGDDKSDIETEENLRKLGYEKLVDQDSSEENYNELVSLAKKFMKEVLCNPEEMEARFEAKSSIKESFALKCNNIILKNSFKNHMTKTII